ncbi:MAG: hypothetical protein AB7U20_22625 [Planctomycetaceae bacterium]
MSHITTEQRAEIERQRQADPARRSFTVEPTPQQREAHAWKAGQALAGREEDQEHFRKMEAASKEPTFSGDLRRAIDALGPDVLQLPEKLGIDRRLLSDFRAGEAPLPSNVIDRLIRELGLTVEVHAPAAEETRV